MDGRLDRIANYFLARSNAAEFSPASIGTTLLPHLFVLDIERAPSGDVSALRIRLVGTALDRAFDRPLKGYRLEEFIHGPRSENVLETFHHCANTRQPVWMRQVVSVRSGRTRSIEGVALYLEPERLYGGVIISEIISRFALESFEQKLLERGLQAS